MLQEATQRSDFDWITSNPSRPKLARPNSCYPEPVGSTKDAATASKPPQPAESRTSSTPAAVSGSPATSPSGSSGLPLQSKQPEPAWPSDHRGRRRRGPMPVIRPGRNLTGARRRLRGNGANTNGRQRSTPAGKVPAQPSGVPQEPEPRTPMRGTRHRPPCRHSPGEGNQPEEGQQDYSDCCHDGNTAQSVSEPSSRMPGKRGHPGNKISRVHTGSGTTNTPTRNWGSFSASWRPESQHQRPLGLSERCVPSF